MIKITRTNKENEQVFALSATEAVAWMRADFPLGTKGLLNALIEICEGGIQQSVKISYQLQSLTDLAQAHFDRLGGALE